MGYIIVDDQCLVERSSSRGHVVELAEIPGTDAKARNRIGRSRAIARHSARHRDNAFA